ncbi:polyhomeotic-like protein 2 [Artemia franciscana]|uniref:polyhomeotic-like protein 2 n=1 Tax=Artemia franciscana TaxID=6661 RepID=UPI0032DA5FA3
MGTRKNIKIHRPPSKLDEATAEPSVNNEVPKNFNGSLDFKYSPSPFELKVSDDECTPSPTCPDLGPPISGFSLVKEELKNDKDTPNMPSDEVSNPVKWTCNDVYDYFVKVGFKREAETFKEEEVNGITLLVMHRSDLVKGLGLKIGPSVEIFRHILKMQSKFNNE